MYNVRIYQIVGWLIGSLIFSYVFCILFSFIFCLAFNLPWTWLIGTGVWAGAVFVRYVLNAASGKPLIDIQYK